MGRARCRAIAWLCAQVVLVFCGGVLAQTTRSATTPSSQAPGVYDISGFDLKYQNVREGQPDLRTLRAHRYRLAESDGVVVGPEEGPTPLVASLDELSGRTRRYGWSAIQAISSQMVHVLNRQGLIGIHVGPADGTVAVMVDNQEVASGGKDLRPGAQGTFPLVIRTARVSDVRAVYSGPGPHAAGAVTAPKDPVLRDSPLQAAPDATAGALDRRDLDEYVALLNRHPDRRVDVALSPGVDPSQGDVTLDYLVQQQRPWHVYAGASNTGTRQTSEWRERFGITNNQLTGNDDIFNLDFSTASFDKSYALNLSYEAPVGDLRRLRYRVYGSWNQYTSSSIGLDLPVFDGEQWSAGGDLIWNFYQKDRFFLDLVGGARFDIVSAEQQLRDPTTGRLTGLSNQSSQFLFPHLGLQMQQVRSTDSLFGMLDLSYNVAEAAHTDSNAALAELGRAEVDRSFAILAGSVNYSFYLEPLLNPRAWADVDFNHPDRSSQWATLAHELSFQARGQYTFGQRVIPQYLYTMGGFATVRGYEEALLSGDTAVVGTAEYRWHLPRSFGVGANPADTPLFGQPFRVTPEVPYGAADWDLIFRTFVDAGWVSNADAIAGEGHELLVGTGVGLEFVFKSNFSIRTDWGIALRDAGGATAGSNRFYVSALFTF